MGKIGYKTTADTGLFVTLAFKDKDFTLLLRMVQGKICPIEVKSSNYKSHGS
ncbi:MAG: hypothetical protein J5534_12500 [Fibrobacter sp.]|nr:hypothetical protein [Fibrobacter sp.]